MTTPSFDLAAAHRWFAIECNNVAWDLVEQENRSTEQAVRMVHAAHASWFHWVHAGSAVHRVRAEMLLSTVHAAEGDPNASLRYARSCEEQATLCDADLSAFDRACMACVLAHALRAAGEAEQSREQFAHADSLAQVCDSDDQALLLRLYPRSQVTGRIAR